MPRIAIVGGGLTGFVAYLTLRRGSIPAEEVAVFLFLLVIPVLALNIRRFRREV